MKNEIIQRTLLEFTRAKTNNSLYSLRAFAGRLKIPPSALSEILNGKRTITKKMAIRILDGLGVPPEESNAIVTKSKLTKEHIISLEQFKIISNWYYFAILSLSETDDFNCDINWISRRLNISKNDTAIAIKRLIKLKMLIKNQDGRYFPSGISYKTPSDILNMSLRNHTIETLKLAQESIVNDPIEIRDFSTITMAIDPNDIPQAKKMIQAFRKRLSKRLESKNKKEVYKLAIQLFPLSKNNKE